MTTTGLDFLMYLVDDIPAARRFYEPLLGVQPGELNSEYYVEYVLPDGTAFSLAKDPSTERIPCGGAVFGVSDLNLADEAIIRLGGKIIRNYGGETCDSLWCLDPFGNPFGLHKRR